MQDEQIPDLPPVPDDGIPPAPSAGIPDIPPPPPPEASSAESDLKTAEKEALKAVRAAEKAAIKAMKDEEKARKAAEREAAKAEKAAAKASKPQMPEQNGIRAPKPGGLCDQAWTAAVEASNTLGRTATMAEVLELAKERGLNEGNVRTEYARWRKFHGIPPAGRQPKPETPENEVPPIPSAPIAEAQPELPPLPEV